MGHSLKVNVMKKLLCVLFLCPLLACACDDDNDACEDIDNAAVRLQCIEKRDGIASPTPIPVPVARTYTVEYRVLGSARRANIVYANTIHGSTELTTGLPWFADFRTNRDRVFVSLYAKSGGDGVVRVQILVDGVLFREASTDGFFGSEIEISGTFLHPDTMSIASQSNVTN